MQVDRTVPATRRLPSNRVPSAAVFPSQSRPRPGATVVASSVSTRLNRPPASGIKALSDARRSWGWAGEFGWRRPARALTLAGCAGVARRKPQLFRSPRSGSGAVDVEAGHKSDRADPCLTTYHPTT
jgi:hypothetical protein